MSNNQSKIDINTMMSRIEQPTPIKDNSSQLVPTQLDTIKFNGDNYKLSLKWIKSICDQLTKQYGDTAVRVVFIPQTKKSNVVCGIIAVSLLQTLYQMKKFKLNGKLKKLQVLKTMYYLQLHWQLTTLYLQIH